MAASKKSKTKLSPKPTAKIVAKGKSVKAAAPKAAPVKSATPKSAAPKAAALNPAALEKLVRPLGDRLLIFVDVAPEKTAGGIFIPATVSPGRPTRGQVVAKGTGRRNKKGQVRPLDVAVGDFVLFPDYAGTKLQLQGTDLLMLHEAEVLGIAE